MKRKIAMGLCVGMLTLSLVGCSSDKGTDKAFTGDKTTEMTIGQDKKETLVTTVSFEESKPVDVKIDVKMEDGKMKKEVAAAGGYEMPNATAPWNKQIETLEDFIVENNFDLSKVTVSKEGKTDAVSGVTIAVPEYVEGVQKALDEVK
ncbi:hypothetical protein [Romboutsia sp.]|uniref:hypothetical protein n=1 Tax=Romboutsia sp. TaxID=1965302 RepID=UPI003F2E0BE9